MTENLILLKKNIVSLQAQAVTPILVEMEVCAFPTTTATIVIVQVLIMETIVNFQVRNTNYVQGSLE